MPSEDEKAYVIALVRAHLITEPEYRSWVPPYTKVRWAPFGQRCVAERANLPDGYATPLRVGLGNVPARSAAARILQRS